MSRWCQTFGKHLVCTILFAVVLGAGAVAYAHDPAATPAPEWSHLHVKGRITTTDGTPISNARLEAVDIRKLVPGVSIELFAKCQIVGPLNGITGAPPMATGAIETVGAGQYEFFIAMKTTEPDCRATFDRLAIDRSQMKWQKAGYDIKSR